MTDPFFFSIIAEKDISMKEELIETAGFSSTFERDRLEKLIELTVIEIFKILADPVSTNKAVYTTHDAGIAGAIVEQAINAISEKFEIQKPQGIKYEAVMGRKVSTI